MTPAAQTSLPRVCAVSYLNTVPLVWGLIAGPQKGEADVTFAVPSVCADRVASGEADLGIIPTIEMAHLGLGFLRGTGIACRGPVRSIFLVSRVPFTEIKTLATDTGSRTSVQLARIILARKYGTDPILLPMAPDLRHMLDAADAALLIGDAALALDPAELDYPCLDLGEEWVNLTGLPMVFAVWSGRSEVLTPAMEQMFNASCQFGLANLDRIIEEEAMRRGFPDYLVHQYLTRHIVLQLDDRDYEGMNRYLAYAAVLEAPVYEQATTI